MSVASFRTPEPLRAALSLPLWRRLSRWLMLGFGGLLMLIGMVGSVLPGHLGVPVESIIEWEKGAPCPFANMLETSIGVPLAPVQFRQ